LGVDLRPSVLCGALYRAFEPRARLWVIGGPYGVREADSHSGAVEEAS
jgi:hypothetical protein